MTSVSDVSGLSSQAFTQRRERQEGERREEEEGVEDIRMDLRQKDL